MLIPYSFKRQSRYDPDSDDILSLIQIQYGYTPDTAVILLPVQTSAIRYILDMLQIRKPFYFLFRFNYQLQVQIHSKTRRSFCHLSRSQLQHIYVPYPEVILLLIQISFSNTVQIRSRFEYHYVALSNYLSTISRWHL